MPRAPQRKARASAGTFVILCGGAAAAARTLDPSKTSDDDRASPDDHPVVPLFPLPDVWLHPGVVMPLRIFEPRYRQMIEESLDGPGRLVIGTVVEGHEPEVMGAPPVYPVAGLGEIGRHERLPDGRFHVQIVGLARVRVHERPSERLYRRVAAEPLPESEPGGSEAKKLRAELVKALKQRMPTPQPLPNGIPIGRLADLLSLRLPLAHARAQELFAELDAGRRARSVLDDFRRTISAAAG